MGDRLVVGRQILDLTTKVRILVPQPLFTHHSHRRVTPSVSACTPPDWTYTALGDRLVVGRRPLEPATQVRILVPQPFHCAITFVSVTGNNLPICPLQLEKRDPVPRHPFPWKYKTARFSICKRYRVAAMIYGILGMGGYSSRLCASLTLLTPSLCFSVLYTVMHWDRTVLLHRCF